MEKEECLKSSRDLSSQQFRQQLNNWFEKNGVVDNLRSHLRSLMVTALQRTEMCIKPQQKTSPKTQSVNMLVAEYLLKHGCYYSLSVLMSELPALTNFGSGAAMVPNDGRKPSARYQFEDSEIVEILNSLGLTCCEDNLKNFCDLYMQNKEDESLLECLLRLVAKIPEERTVERHDTNIESCLSKEWFAAVDEILLRAKGNMQMSDINQSLRRITEDEVKRAILEENTKHTRELIKREKRIQEYLQKHESDLLQRLKDAEEELNLRRDTIDKELSERQQHLARMALEWQERHKQILSISKDFAVTKNENKALKDRIADMEREMNGLELEIKKKTEIIDRFQSEKMSFKCHVQEYLSWKDKRDAGMTSERRDGVPFESRDKADSISYSSKDDLSGTEETILNKIKLRLEELENESSKLCEKYKNYRIKYEECEETDSEVISNVVEDKTPEMEPVITVKETTPCSEIKAIETAKEPSPDDEVIEDDFLKDVTCNKSEITDELTTVFVPTKRQQKNREYFLKSRSLLDVLEKSSGLMDGSSLSSSDLSLCYSSVSNKDDGKRDANEKADAATEMEMKETDGNCLKLSDLECLTLLKETTHRSSVDGVGDAEQQSTHTARS